MIRRQVTMPVETERLWEALTDPDQASGWLGGRIEWDLREGSPLLFVDEDGSLRWGQLDVIRAGRYLRYRWWGEAGDVSEVSYLLEPDGAGTRLTIQERSVEPVRPAGTGPAAAASGSASGTVGAARAVGPRVSWSHWDTALAALWVLLSAATFCRVGA
jgi:uncharacterized protein YndB with AHSA1/START domain